jgi:DNA-binding NarL/FixJ family response regulator
MEMQRLNLFILSDNALVVNGLRHYLESRFPNRVMVTGFYDGKSCLKKVDQNTHVVVMDYFLEGRSSLPTLKCIEAINPRTKIIMHSCNQDVELAVEKLLKGEVIYNTALRYREKMLNQYR